MSRLADMVRPRLLGFLAFLFPNIKQLAFLDLGDHLDLKYHEANKETLTKSLEQNLSDSPFMSLFCLRDFCYIPKT